MKTQKVYLFVLLLIACIFSISNINANEDMANEDIISVDNNENNFETNIRYDNDDVSTSNENSKLNLEQSNNNEEKKV